MLDTTQLLFTITDLKQYVYCPRIFYYHMCLPDIRPITYKMQAGITAHDEEHKRATRRLLHMYHETEGRRSFDVPVQSTVFGLSGQIDEVVETSSELIPVDYKLARKAAYHFKVQLAAYALLLEENYPLPAKRGFLYMLFTRQTVEVPITTALRREVCQALEVMRVIVESEHMPAATAWRQRCPDCEFRRFCNDT